MNKSRLGRIVWGALLVGIAFCAVLAPWLSPYDPRQTDLAHPFTPPDAAHWLGTDHFGRDVLSQLVWGSRQSLLSATFATVVALSVGIGIGVTAGGVGNTLDWVLMRGVDILLALPSVLLAMVLVAMFGIGIAPVALGVGLSLAPLLCRVTRAAVLSVRGEVFIESARALGAGRWHIIRRHLMPNVTEQVVAFVVVTYAWSLLNVAALEYLGLAGSPSVPSWGRMLNEGRAYLGVAPWIALSAGAVLTLTVLALMGYSDSGRSVRWSDVYK